MIGNELAAVPVSARLLLWGVYLGRDGRELVGEKNIASIECAAIRKEGYYKVEVTVGVRDVRFGEYSIPIEGDSGGVMFLCISSM